MSEDLLSRLELQIAPGDRLLLDTTVFVSYFSGGDRWADAARELVEGMVRSGRNPAIVSTLTVMESLVGPMRRVPPGHQTAVDFFAHWPNLSLMPVDLAVAQEGASICAHHGFPAPDALIIGSGVLGGVAWLVTGDERWQKRLAQITTRLRVCYLGDFV